VTTPPRYRNVKLRCAKCRRQFGHAESLQGKEFVITVDERYLDGPATTLSHTALQCKCGYRPAVSVVSVDKAAPKAWELGADLMIGAPNSGLPQ
jgi:hypothetical protein